MTAADVSNDELMLTSFLSNASLSDSRSVGRFELTGILMLDDFNAGCFGHKVFLTTRKEWLPELADSYSVFPTEYWMKVNQGVTQVQNPAGENLGFKRILDFYDGYPTNGDTTKKPYCLHEYFKIRDDDEQLILCKFQSSTDQDLNDIPFEDNMKIPFLFKINPKRIGFQFVPTDQELLINYLIPKGIPAQPSLVKMIPEALVYDMNPEALSAGCPSFAKDEWYFFSSSRYEGPRVTENGYWRSRGIAQAIYSQDGVQLGSKLDLNFCKKSGTKTKWIMTEYRAENKDVVLCLIRPLSAKRNREERSA